MSTQKELIGGSGGFVSYIHSFYADGNSISGKACRHRADIAGTRSSMCLRLHQEASAPASGSLNPVQRFRPGVLHCQATRNMPEKPAKSP